MFELIDYTSVARTRYTDLFKRDQAFDCLVTTITEVLKEYQEEYQWLVKNSLSVDLQSGSGLDFIGKIVNQKRLLTDFNQDVHFGFKDSYKSGTFGTVADPSVGAEWYSMFTMTQGGGRVLTDEEYRAVIKARIISRNTNCSTKDLISVINHLTFSNQNSVSWDKHGVINLNISEDDKGLLSYFLSKIDTQDNILPIPLGYRIEQRYVG